MTQLIPWSSSWIKDEKGRDSNERLPKILIWVDSIQDAHDSNWPGEGLPLASNYDRTIMLYLGQIESPTCFTSELGMSLYPS